MILSREDMINKKCDFLRDVAKNPSKYREDDDLYNSLKSQGAFASFENKDLGINKCSLNTLKTAAIEYLPDGFVEINTLRLNAKDALNTFLKGESSKEETTENTKTIAGSKRKSGRLQSELNQVREQNYLLSIIITEMKSKMKELATSKESVDKRKASYQLFDEHLEYKLSYTLRNEELKSEY